MCSGTIVCVYLCVSTCVFVYVAQRYLLAYVCLYARVLDGMRVDGMLWHNCLCVSVCMCLLVSVCESMVCSGTMGSALPRSQQSRHWSHLCKSTIMIMPVTAMMMMMMMMNMNYIIVMMMIVITDWHDEGAAADQNSVQS